jgi:UDP-N-acetyl-D-galactosamine dehydrogenase
METNNTKCIAIIGLGYVGLPLAVAFGKYRPTIGYDLNKERVSELKKGHDSTLEILDEDLAVAINLTYTSYIDDIKDADIYIITVPTPIDKNKRPNLRPLMQASETVGKILKKGDLVIFESTVYPGATEEDCVPVLEKNSGLVFNRDFYCGYSPERINAGDKIHTLSSVVKITSGSTSEIATEVDILYKEIITAGTFPVSSIRIAEAAKVIENAQRDINIAFANELSCIFNLMNIDTLEVLQAASTKWNFLTFYPGLVGGHCIGVDPYYLTHKAQELNYTPDVILAGRRVNDGMGRYVAVQVMKLVIGKQQKISGSHVLVLGITFKENCTDIRNSRVLDLIQELKDFGCIVDVVDPWANANEVKKEYKINLLAEDNLPLENGRRVIENYAAVIIAVAHDNFKEYDYSKMIDNTKVIYDIKGILPKEMIDGRL